MAGKRAKAHVVWASPGNVLALKSKGLQLQRAAKELMKRKVERIQEMSETKQVSKGVKFLRTHYSGPLILTPELK